MSTENTRELSEALGVLAYSMNVSALRLLAQQARKLEDALERERALHREELQRGYIVREWYHATRRAKDPHFTFSRMDREITAERERRARAARPAQEGGPS